MFSIFAYTVIEGFIIFVCCEASFEEEFLIIEKFVTINFSFDVLRNVVQIWLGGMIRWLLRVFVDSLLP